MSLPINEMRGYTRRDLPFQRKAELLVIHLRILHKLKLSFPACAMRTLLVLITLQLPVSGNCQPGNGWFRNLFESKSKHMKDVAMKVAELPERYNINVRALDFSPDGRHLAVRSADQIIHIWDWQNERIVHSLEIAKGANDGLSTEPLRFSPDGHLLAACHSRAAGDIVIRIWRTDTWDIVHDIVDHVGSTGCNAVGFTPDGRWLIRVLERLPNVPGDTLVVYETETWQPGWGMRTVPFYTYTLAISPDGQFMALGGEVMNPRDWPFSTPVPTFGNPPFPNTKLIAIVDLTKRTIVRTIQNTGVMDSRSRLAWSPDGAYITNAGGEGLQMFDAQAGQQVMGIAPSLGTAITSLRYSSDGKYLVEGIAHGKPGWGKIWDGKHQELLQEITEDVGSIAISQDAKHLATGVNGKTIIWQLK